MSLGHLSEKDSRIARLMAAGLSDAEIGRKLFYPPVAPESVAEEITRICQIVGVLDRRGLKQWVKDNY